MGKIGKEHRLLGNNVATLDLISVGRQETGDGYVRLPSSYLLPVLLNYANRFPTVTDSFLLDTVYTI